MKWKITRQFIAVLAITIGLSFITFIFFNAFLIYQSVSRDESGYLESNILDFKKYVVYKDRQVTVSKEGLKELKNKNGWIQVLDENGNELYSKFKPNNAPTHYVPGELIFYHKYADALEGSTIYAGMKETKGRKFTYIIGAPSDVLVKYSFSYDPQSFIKQMIYMVVGSFIIVTVIYTFVGFRFSKRLAKPILRIIDGVKELAKGDYSRTYEEKGVYQEVHESLNHLVGTLQSNEKERKRIERIREEWITNISHDIKTPLSSIKGYSEFLEDPDYDISLEDRIKYAAIIRGKADYIEKLVDDLKLTYQLKNEMLPFDRENLDLVDIVRETIIDILNHPAYTDANVHFHCEELSILMLGDGKLLQRAFSNLIFNSLVHNPIGTEVHVTVKRNGNSVRVRIADNGKGIPESELDLLFERYYRGTNTGEAHKGSGLGMAIAKQIVEIHGGKISVSSEVDKGTTIEINF